MTEESVSAETVNLGYSGCRVYRARRLRRHGAVGKVGLLLTMNEAIAERVARNDVVVCGDNLATNLTVAQTIEAKSTGNYHQRHPAHRKLGKRALPHFQHRFHKDGGHTFYESPPDRMTVKERKPK